MKEIGGYFGLEKFSGMEYHENALALNTGRNALYYLIMAKKPRKIYIPYFLCASVFNLLIKIGIEFGYYRIQADFTPEFNKKLKEDEFLYIVNYYGQLTNEMILMLKRQYGNIIMDNTQAFFQEPVKGIDTIYSCRKFFGVPDGAYLSTEKECDFDLEKDVSKKRMSHILGRFEDGASEYYGDFKEIDRLFSEEPLKTMSDLTRNILKAIDYDQVSKVRSENYEYLENELKEENKLWLSTPEGPFAYPFYIENGIEIRTKLALKKIYIPTLWPNVLKNSQKDSVEYLYTANILPLPCDQRYNLEDMKYMAALLKENMVELSSKY